MQCLFYLFVLFYLQGIVTGIGENSEFGEVFKMMQAEEVRTRSYNHDKWGVFK